MIDLRHIADRMERADSVPRIPKYVKLFNAIYASVENGEFPSGAQFPAESELAKLLPASLGTVQKALNMLAERGVVIREHGKGTFVAGRSNALDGVWHFRFLADADNKILPVFTEVLSVDCFTQPGPWNEHMGKPDRLIRITRRINVDSQFEALSWFFLDPDIFSDLLSTPPKVLNGVHLRDVMREQFDIVTIRVTERVSAETLPADVCLAIGIRDGEIGLVCHIRGYGHRDAPVSYQVLFVPPNAPRLEIREHKPSLGLSVGTATGPRIGVQEGARP